MRVLLLVLTFLSGCATTATVVPSRGDADVQAAFAQSGGTTRSTSGTRTQTVGLPLSRAGKIGLWSGVAVFLAYLMHSDGEDDGAGTAEP